MSDLSIHALHAFTYRRFDMEQDLAAVVTLLNEVRLAEQDDDLLSEGKFSELLTWSGQKPAENARVALTSETAVIVGFGLLQKTTNDKNADLLLAVHPSVQGQGIGSQLLSLLLSRGGELHAQAVRGYVNVVNQAATHFALAHGFEPVSAYTRLAIEAWQPFPQPELPSGFVARSYDQVQRLDLFVQAMNRGYAGRWGHLHISEEEVAIWFPRLKQEGIVLLFAPDGAVAGVGRAELSERLTARRGMPIGLIDAPGVVPEYRDSGLYVPLLLTLLHWLLTEQPAYIEIESWGDDPRTLALYRDLGFQVAREELSYRRIL
jgi:mycothiol synthase